MYLNNATISKWELNSKNYENSKKRFMKDLLETHRFSVQAVLGTKLATGGNVTFIENNGWVIAHVDLRFALANDTLFSGLALSILNNNQEIMSSYTDVSVAICGDHDIDADLYFVVGSIYPYNSNKDNLPESFFRSSLSQMLPRLDFSKLPDAVGGGDEDDGNEVLVSLPFAVSNGYSLEDEINVVYNTNEQAILKVYMDKSDFDSLKSKVNPDFYFGFMMPMGATPDMYGLAVHALTSNGGQAAEIVMEGSTSDEDRGKNNLLSRDVVVGVHDNESDPESTLSEYPATVKFFIGNNEIKSSSYVPINTTNEAINFCIYEPGSQNEDLPFKSSSVELIDGNSIYYKLGVFTSTGAVKERLDNIKSWAANLNKYGSNEYGITISDESNSFTLNVSSINSDNITLNDAFYVIGENHMTAAFIRVQTFNEDGSNRYDKSLLTGSSMCQFTKM